MGRGGISGAKELFRTPVMYDNLNPVWNFSASIETEARRLKFVVADKDNWTHDDYMGECLVEVRSRTTTTPLKIGFRRADAVEPTLTVKMAVEGGDDDCCG